MKKIASIFIAFMLVIALSACRQTETTSSQSDSGPSSRSQSISQNSEPSSSLPDRDAMYKEFMKIISYEHKLECRLQGFITLYDETEDWGTLLKVMPDGSDSSMLFFIPERLLPPFFSKSFVGYFIGEQLIIYYDGEYEDWDMYSTTVKGISCNYNDWDRTVIPDNVSEMEQIYLNMDEIAVNNHIQAMEMVNDYLGLNLEKNITMSGVVYYGDYDAGEYIMTFDIYNNDRGVVFYSVCEYPGKSGRYSVYADNGEILYW